MRSVTQVAWEAERIKNVVVHLLDWVAHIDLKEDRIKLFLTDYVINEMVNLSIFTSRDFLPEVMVTTVVRVKRVFWIKVLSYILI